MKYVKLRWALSGLVVLVVLASLGLTPAPREMARALAHQARVYLSDDYRRTADAYRWTDVDGLVTMRTAGDVAAVRQRLLDILWGSRGLPRGLPADVRRDVHDARFADARTLARIDALRIDMPFGLVSHVYHFVPLTPTDKVVLFHEGHEGDFARSRKDIHQLLAAGYAVVAFSMPLVGANRPPVVDVPNVGKFAMTSHDQMQFLQPESGHPIQYFLEPVVVALNYLEREFRYASISMLGISGGGWTTTMAAAADTRIQNSYPVAGTLPMHLRMGSTKDWGDYEQTTRDVYLRVNYLELYVLGAAGHRRRQVQILNQFDPCCFSGTKSETYADTIGRRVAALGSGHFELWLDATHREHAISEHAMKRIIADIGRARP